MTAESDSGTPTSRRQFLRAAGVAAVRPAAIVGTVAVGGSMVASADHFDLQPESVTLDFDRTFLETYQPRLDLSAVRDHPDDALPKAMYAWRARSEDYETDVAVYWTEYPYQKGLSPFGHDSHFGDHEPCYVFVDSETGDVREVVYSAYHWLRGRTMTPPLYEETHVEATVVSPWHQYAQSPGVEGEFVDVEDLGGRFEEWLEDESFHDALAPGVTVNPWRMQSRSHWWREGRDGLSVNEMYVGSVLWMSNTVPVIDFGGASSSDSTE